MKILVAFSGGVDSAMAALLLRDQGHEVTGAIMSLRGEESTAASPELPGFGCGEKEDLEGARRLAEHINLPLAVVDCSRAYREHVLDYFRREYLAGRTPNPCIRCNPLLKFALLPELARGQGAEFERFATGHYARVEYSEQYGRHILRRGIDPGKDQSYFLYRLNSEQLARTVFPLGELTKPEVRVLAARRGLPVHDKPDSQDFHVGDYAELLGMPPRPGYIVRGDGTVVGRHQGYWHFTPGQRKGLGVAYREPLYVMRVDPGKNEVVVGTRSEQLRTGCVARNLIFTIPRPAPETKLTGRMRSSQPPQRLTVTENGPDSLTVSFDQPQHGVAPGQSLVLYDGDMVVGGGIIEQSI